LIKEKKTPRPCRSF